MVVHVYRYTMISFVAARIDITVKGTCYQPIYNALLKRRLILNDSLTGDTIVTPRQKAEGGL